MYPLLATLDVVFLIKTVSNLSINKHDLTETKVIYRFYDLLSWIGIFGWIINASVDSSIQMFYTRVIALLNSLYKL